ncbi:MAG: hypothetical protein ACI9S8_001254 [Chlamydiales bacterium]|jgi:hypothetical protein
MEPSSSFSTSTRGATPVHQPPLSKSTSHGTGRGIEQKTHSIWNSFCQTISSVASQVGKSLAEAIEKGCCSGDEFLDADELNFPDLEAGHPAQRTDRASKQTFEHEPTLERNEMTDPRRAELHTSFDRKAQETRDHSLLQGHITQGAANESSGLSDSISSTWGNFTKWVESCFPVDTGKEQACLKDNSFQPLVLKAPEQHTMGSSAEKTHKETPGMIANIGDTLARNTAFIDAVLIVDGLAGGVLDDDVADIGKVALRGGQLSELSTPSSTPKNLAVDLARATGKTTKLALDGAKVETAGAISSGLQAETGVVLGFGVVLAPLAVAVGAWRAGKNVEKIVNMNVHETAIEASVLKKRGLKTGFTPKMRQAFVKEILHVLNLVDKSLGYEDTREAIMAFDPETQKVYESILDELQKAEDEAFQGGEDGTKPFNELNETERQQVLSQISNKITQLHASTALDLTANTALVTGGVLTLAGITFLPAVAVAVPIVAGVGIVAGLGKAAVNTVQIGATHEETAKLTQNKVSEDINAVKEGVQEWGSWTEKMVSGAGDRFSQMYQDTEGYAESWVENFEKHFPGDTEFSDASTTAGSEYGDETSPFSWLGTNLGIRVH